MIFPRSVEEQKRIDEQDAVVSAASAAAVAAWQETQVARDTLTPLLAKLLKTDEETVRTAFGWEKS